MSKPAEQTETGKQTSLEALDQALFNEIADKYCRKDLLPASRIARRQRLRKTLLTLKAESDISILEVGCGAGFSARFLEGLYSRFVGIDYAENLIAYAHKYNNSERTEYYAENIKNFETEEKFDVVLMIGVLHHFDNVEEILKHITGMLKPGGWIIANEPQSSSFIIQAMRKIRTRLDSSYSPYQKQFSPEELCNAYRNCGLSNISVTPQGFFSTPFAEVIMRPQLLFYPMAWGSVILDRMLEKILGRLLMPFSWNVIAAGQLP